MNAEAIADEEVRTTIKGMIEDLEVVIAREGGAVYVSIARKGGCKKVYKNVCNFLKKRYPDKDVFLLESPVLGQFCYARVRRARTRHFARVSIRATAPRLAIT